MIFVDIHCNGSAADPCFASLSTLLSRWTLWQNWVCSGLPTVRIFSKWFVCFF